MTELETSPIARRCAFDDLECPGDDKSARLTPAPALARLSLRMAFGDARRLQGSMGAWLGGQINTAITTGPDDRAALRLGPDEWLVLVAMEHGEAVRGDIQSAASGLPHALVDVSDRNAGGILSGPRAADVLAAGCALPLDPGRFPVGRATRTLFARAEVVLWRRAPDRFHIETGRSFLPYVAGVLGEAIVSEAAIARLADQPPSF